MPQHVLSDDEIDGTRKGRNQSHGRARKDLLIFKCMNRHGGEFRKFRFRRPYAPDAISETEKKVAILAVQKSQPIKSNLQFA